MSTLDPRADFAGRDDFLDLLLGLLACGRSVERLLAAEVAHPSLLAPACPSDGFDHLLLGLLSFSVRLRDALDPGPRRAPPPIDGGPPRPRNLLL